MTWEDILKATDGLDQYNVDELLVQPIERLGFQQQQIGDLYFLGDEGASSFRFIGPTGIAYVIKRAIMTLPSGNQYSVFKGNEKSIRLFDYNAVVDYFTNEMEALT